MINFNNFAFSCVAAHKNMRQRWDEVDEPQSKISMWVTATIASTTSKTTTIIIALVIAASLVATMLIAIVLIATTLVALRSMATRLFLIVS
jgi:hypothetical protein